MGIRFNADEIFEMAEEIERQGARFYRKAAESASDAEIKGWLQEMAAMEDGHEKAFAAMRLELSASEKEYDSFDPDGEAGMYLKVMADSHGTEGKKSASEELTGQEGLGEILASALSAEKESVVFYTGLKELVSASAGREKVEAIIREEIGHVAAIQKKIGELGA